MELRVGFCPYSSSGTRQLRGSLCLYVTPVRERGPQSASLSLTGHADTTNQVGTGECWVGEWARCLGEPGSELPGSCEDSRCHKTKKAGELRWRLNNPAEERSNQTLKLHLPGERPGPGSGEDSPTEDPPQPPTASRIACSSAGGNFSHSLSSRVP